jgi:rubrerythrin
VSSEENAQFPQTVESLKKRYVDEMHAYQKYVAYSHKAIDEDYPNIAHLFKALASSEAIHARNFERILSALSIGAEELPAVGLVDFKIGRTKENIKHATQVEAEKIDNEYPAILARIKPEGYQNAITHITYAWKAEKQHHDLMIKIRNAATKWFGLLASRIEGTSSRYYICHICGSTLIAPPKEQCPICGHSHTEYQEVAGYPGPPQPEEDMR